jgi:putative transposase
VRGFKAYKIVRDYIQLNEQEALKKMPYRKERLRGLSMRDWEVLWG